MHYEIAEVSTHAGTGLTYVLVNFWRSSDDREDGLRPFLVNDFFMTLPSTGERIVTDSEGRMLLTTGEWVEPQRADESLSYEKETFAIDPRVKLIANIEQYVARAEARKETGNRAARRVKRVTHIDLADLEGTIRDSAVAR